MASLCVCRRTDLQNRAFVVSDPQFEQVADAAPLLGRVELTPVGTGGGATPTTRRAIPPGGIIGLEDGRAGGVEEGRGSTEVGRWVGTDVGIGGGPCVPPLLVGMGGGPPRPAVALIGTGGGPPFDCGRGGTGTRGGEFDAGAGVVVAAVAAEPLVAGSGLGMRPPEFVGESTNEPQSRFCGRADTGAGLLTELFDSLLGEGSADEDEDECAAR